MSNRSERRQVEMMKRRGREQPIIPLTDKTRALVQLTFGSKTILSTVRSDMHAADRKKDEA